MMPRLVAQQKRRTTIDMPLTSRQIADSFKAVMMADITIKPATMSEFVVAWEDLMKMPVPLELVNVPHGLMIRRILKTMVFSADMDLEASKKFKNDLETEIYSLVALHKNMVDKYAQRYSLAVYQMSRGIQSVISGGRETQRWFEIVSATMAILHTMVD